MVILAILAALLLPALTGYIDKAKEKQIIAETRQIVMAAQTLGDEEYAKVDEDTNIEVVKANTNITKAGQVSLEEIADLAEIASFKEQETTTLTFSGGKVATVEYTAHGKTCTYRYNTSASKGDHFEVKNAE